MEPERRNQLLLGAVAMALAAAAYGAWPRTSLGPAPTSNGTAGATTAPRVPAASTASPDVHLPMLEAERPRPVSGARNLFRFRPKPPPPPPPTPVAPVERPPVTVAPPGPGGPPPPPPIVLKFIGTVEAPGRSAQKIAVLSDGRNVFHGREGDIIEGRFRILRIGAESIEMAYLDGRGRQTIRLTGG